MPEWKQEIRRRLANLKLDPAREVVIVEEMEEHLADYYADMLAGGRPKQKHIDGRWLNYRTAKCSGVNCGNPNRLIHESLLREALEGET